MRAADGWSSWRPHGKHCTIRTVWRWLLWPILDQRRAQRVEELGNRVYMLGLKGSALGCCFFPHDIINSRPLTLRRFISLRGPVRKLRSDQGTNFVGASNELTKAWNEIDDEQVRSYLLKNGCDFQFNVPHSSHMGGVWERLIRTTRSILAGLLNQHGMQLDDEGLRTLMQRRWQSSTAGH